MTDAMRLLKQKRSTVKGQVTRILNFMNQTAEVSPVEARIRLDRLKELWEKFDQLQIEIDEKPCDSEEELQARMNDSEAERTIFEAAYYDAAAKTQRIVEAFERQELERQQIGQPQANEGRRNRPKLPQIHLPEFSGEYTKWVFFKNSFESTIHNETDLTPVQKHQYLIGVLRGEALNVIQGFSITDTSYESAWQLLKDTYDDRTMIIETHLDEMLHFPNITKENKAESIRQFVWHIQTHYKSLEALDQPVKHWETIIIHLAKKKLDFIEQRDWQTEVKGRNSNNMPKLEEFLKFLNERCQTLRLLGQSRPKSTNEKATQQKGKEKAQKNASLTATSVPICKICQGQHPIYRCEELLKQSVEDRWKEIRNKQLCMNCLSSGHFAKQCKSSSCQKCSARHNTILHREVPQPSGSKEPERQVVAHCAEGALAKETTEASGEACEGTLRVYCTQKPTSQVILSTARVYAYDKRGQKQTCRVLLDPGSQSNLVTERCVKRLQLPCQSEDRMISGVNQLQTSAGKSVTIRIQSTCSEFATTLQCLVLPSITDSMPQNKIDVTRIIVPKGISLADPVFEVPGQIDVLIGAGVYWNLLRGAPRNRIEGQPAWQDTQLGWIIGGEISDVLPKRTPACLTITNEGLNQQLERFWQQENIPETPHYTDEEKDCERYFAETCRRDSTGRFIVRLPIRNDVVLGESKKLALKRLMSLERKLARDEDLKTAYFSFMEDYIAQNHMTLVTEEVQRRAAYVIPHQAVVRPDSVTTKIRVVFDASAKTVLGTSLNDKLMAGPNLQRDLMNIILRFRAHECVLTADIAMMFRQILVDERDRALQRILWRNCPMEPMRMYELNTVTYGTACAPYLAMRCLRQLANDESTELPRAAKALIEDCYMDDILTGARTIKEASELQKELSQLLRRGQFHLRKWRTNDARILHHLQEECKTDKLLMLDKEVPQKTLGLLWSASQDRLQYQIEIEKRHTVTKRLVLSRIAQVFDPLGLIAPLLINGKIIMQQLWALEIDWDQPLPQGTFETWNGYYTSLARINVLRIPRNVVPANASESFDVFGFGDASEKAYGACVYAVSVDVKGERHSQLICSRSKVAPLKTISLPRLELEAALLLANLYATISSAYEGQLREVKLWSDSTIVLGWIKAQPNTLKTFVANRVSKIQTRAANATWHHVPSEENPADLLSRGITVDRLLEERLWWHGPAWLTAESQWPKEMREPESHLPEQKSCLVGVMTTNATSILRRFSSYCKMQRVIAYCLRWRYSKKEGLNTQPLAPKELERSEKAIVRIVQGESFSQEIRGLQTNQEVHRKSQMRALTPSLDSEGLIRVGGRLRNANISEEQKHQLVLPARHFVTNLIMKAEHVRLHHCPPLQLLNSVRYKFWPLSGRREANKVVKSCLSCYRFKPVSAEVKMGDLPKQRVSGFGRPFITTGVDYAGPLQIRESRRRGRVHVTKGYIAVFTCFSTKAVHLELVTELTTEAFLAALRRFTARRGICTQIFSDNATNFVGAARELKEIYEFLERENAEIKTTLAQQRIEWHFIPPRAPNFGGLWEAAVKMAKRHLYTMTKGRVHTYEEYSTLLTDIEAILNSRPLTTLSNDPADLSPLTPSHFLVGDSLLQPVHRDLTEIPENRLSRWQQLLKLRQEFWRRWQTDYLQELQQRSRWSEEAKNIEIDTLVLLKEDNTPPLQWVLGRVVERYPGADGTVRVVLVKTPNGSFKRAVRRLCPIPVEGDS